MFGNRCRMWKTACLGVGNVKFDSYRLVRLKLHVFCKRSKKTSHFSDAVNAQ